MRNSPILKAVRWVVVLPATAVVLVAALALTWLLVLMTNDFIGSFPFFFIIVSALIVLGGHVWGARWAVEVGAMLAPSRRQMVARFLASLLTAVIVLGTIYTWDRGFGSGDQPGITFLTGLNRGVWRWWLLVCVFAAVVTAWLTSLLSDDINLDSKNNTTPKTTYAP